MATRERVPRALSTYVANAQPRACTTGTSLTATVFTLYGSRLLRPVSSELQDQVRCCFRVCCVLWRVNFSARSAACVTESETENVNISRIKNTSRVASTAHRWGPDLPTPASPRGTSRPTHLSVAAGWKGAHGRWQISLLLLNRRHLCAALSPTPREVRARGDSSPHHPHHTAPRSHRLPGRRFWWTRGSRRRCRTRQRSGSK